MGKRAKVYTEIDWIKLQKIGFVYKNARKKCQAIDFFIDFHVLFLLYHFRFGVKVKRQIHRVIEVVEM